MYPELYLMRHGQTEWNAMGRMQGWQDSPLTAKGRAQAELQASIIASRAVTGFARFSSPLGRARSSAEIIFGGADFVTDARLAEIDIGRFSGELDRDLRAAYPQLFQGGRLDWYDRAPGGEGFAGLRARVRDFLDGLQAPALIVTHGITLHMIRLLALSLPERDMNDMWAAQGVVYHIRDGRHRELNAPEAV